MKVTSKWQVTIPHHIRKKLGIVPQSDVEFVVTGDTIHLKTATGKESKGKRLVDCLRDKATVRMTTEEIMALTRGAD